MQLLPELLEKIVYSFTDGKAVGVCSIHGITEAGPLNHDCSTCCIIFFKRKVGFFFFNSAFLQQLSPLSALLMAQMSLS